MTEHDEDLHDPRLTALYRRRDGEQPPAHLDAAIRTAAHEAVRKPGSRRLWPSLATAALLILGVSVALKVFEQPELDRAHSDRVPVEESSVERPWSDQSQKNGIRIDQDGMTQSSPAPADAKRHGDDAVRFDKAPARREFAPQEARQRESELMSDAVPPVPRAATPSASSAEQGTAPLAEPGQAVGLGAGKRDRAVAEPQADIRDSDLTEVPSELDCALYGDLPELSEEEWRQRLAHFRRRGDEAAIQCLERARKGVQRPADQGR